MISYSGRHRLDPSKAWDGWSLVLFDDDGHPLLGNWDPIVSPKAWSQVQFELQLRRQKRGLAPGTHRNPIVVRYLLSGILKCGKCGRGLVGTKYRTRSGADKKRGYRCPTSAHGGCGGTHVVAHAAEEAVEQAMEVFLHNVLAGSAADEAPSSTALNTLRLTVEKEIERKQGLIRRWTDGSLSEGGLTEDDYFQMLAGSNRKISGLREAITSAEGGASPQLPTEELLDGWRGGELRQRRAVLKRYLHGIDVLSPLQVNEFNRSSFVRERLRPRWKFEGDLGKY